MKKLILLLKKYKEVFLYVIFGVFTTICNIVVYYLCTRIFYINEYSSNIIAWIISVLFAYITNKIFIFKNKEKKFPHLLKESLSFFFFRLISLIIDMASMYLLISFVLLNDLVAKIITNIIVIILNYIFSKFFVFQKK